jgi:hypothetical protein
MSDKTKKPTKAGSLTASFLREAATKPVDALAYMLLQAFGISLASLVAIAGNVLASGDMSVVVMALTAAVQIRNHVVFVGRDFGDIRTKYPELVIEGDRDQKDIYNFGAVHALGHIFAHITSSDLGSKVLKKAGSCITGEGVNASEAGKINEEIFKSWAIEDRTAWPAAAMAMKASHGVALDRIMGALPGMASKFSRSLQPATGGRAPPAAPAKADPAEPKRE